MNLKEMIRYVQQNVLLKEEADRIAERQKEVKDFINKGLEELGEEDSRGHIVAEINDSVSGISKVVKQKRVSKSLDMETAERILKEKDLESRCFTMVPVLNEEEIMAVFYEGLLTEEDIDAMFPAKVSWALVFNK
jgi:SOS-response transcriptional repressor LexA